MALVACHECTREVSTEALVCPHCGAPLKNTARTAGKPKPKSQIWLVVALVVGLIVLSQITGKTPSMPEEPLKAVVRDVGGIFAIQNNDSFPWSNCDIELNSDYDLKGINVPPGETIRVAARDFTTSSGTRFNPVTTKAQKMYIYCRGAPGGARSTLVGWK